VYEPAVLLFGLGGLAWAALRGRRFETLLGLWAGIGTAILSAMPGRLPFEVVGIVTPLALLAGSAAQAVGDTLGKAGASRGTGLYAPAVLVLWAYFYLMLARYAAAGGPSDLVLAALVVALQLLLAVLFAVGMRADSAVCAFAVGTGVALLMVTISAGWRVAHIRAADPRELLVHEPTAVEVQDLVETVTDLSWRETGMPTTLAFTYEAGRDSVLAWYLRGFTAAERVEHLGRDGSGRRLRIVIATHSNPQLPDVAFIGQDFVLGREWRPGDIACVWEWPPQCRAATEWLLFRRTSAPPEATGQAVLWVPDEIAEE
jgi:hypothetical protein